MPWTMKVVSASIRMLISKWGLCFWDRPRVRASRRGRRRGTSCPAAKPLGPNLGSCGDSLDLLDRSARGLVERDGTVGIVDAVLLEDLEALLLPGARDPEDRDLLGGVHVQLQAGLDHAAGDDVHARIGD